MRVSELNALPWQEVKSTNIARLAYQPLPALSDEGSSPGGELFVHFFADGEQSVYRYFDVPDAVYQALTHAKSVGGMHNKIIKGKYRYERVAVEPDPLLDTPEDEVDPLVVALNILAERIVALEAEVSNLVRLITGRTRPRPPGGSSDRDQPAGSDPERAVRPVEDRGA